MSAHERTHLATPGEEIQAAGEVIAHRAGASRREADARDIRFPRHCDRERPPLRLPRDLQARACKVRSIVFWQTCWALGWQGLSGI